MLAIDYPLWLGKIANYISVYNDNIRNKISCNLRC